MSATLTNPARSDLAAAAYRQDALRATETGRRLALANAAPRRNRPSPGRGRPGPLAFVVMVVLTVIALGAVGAELALAYRTPVAVPASWQAAANRDLIVRFYASTWNGRDAGAAGADVDEAHRYHDPLVADVPPGRAGVVTVVGTLQRAFPDLRLALDEVVASDTSVTVRFTLRGTHRGELMGAEGTGRPVAVAGLALHRLDAGRIAETWVAWDGVDLARQLGLALLSPAVVANTDGWDVAPTPDTTGRPT